MRKKKTYGKSSFLLTVLLLVYIFPFFLVLINSFKSKRDVVKNPLSLIGEEGFCPENYLLALKRMDFWNVFLNSGFGIMILESCNSARLKVLLGAVQITALSAYSLSVPKLV